MKINVTDHHQIYELAEKLTGTCQSGRFKREVLVLNVERRMSDCNIKELSKYLKFAQSDKAEYQKLISALTIHTTSWFREMPHYEELLKTIRSFHQSEPKRVFRLWSSACSTGEEVFSSALVLHKFKNENPDFDYEILGSDIDPVSVAHASKMIYSSVCLDSIPKEYHSLLMVGSGKTKGMLTFHPQIRKRCRFAVKNFMNIHESVSDEKWDWIFCRNVLIYFKENDVNDIVQGFRMKLEKMATLCLGHSEAFSVVPSNFLSLGKACYKAVDSVSVPKVNVSSKKNVLVIDDSLVIRKLLGKIFSADSWEVTAVSSAAEADQSIITKDFHLITLDLKMAPVDGLTWLKKSQKLIKNTPVVIVSDSDPKEAAGVFGALEGGAQEYILKTFLHNSPDDFLARMNALALNVHPGVRKVNVSEKGLTFKLIDHPEVILIGASTGGPESISRLIRNLSGELPPVVIVQHINESFTKPFAERLGQISGLMVHEPKENELLERGKLYLAYGDYHLLLKRERDGLKLQKDHSIKHLGHRPAVDPLFKSAAICGAKSISFLLTGMGRDGAEGLKAIRDAGVSTNFAQDEASSIVFGMPKQAIDLGAQHYIANLEQMRKVLESLSVPKVKLTA